MNSATTIKSHGESIMDTTADWAQLGQSDLNRLCCSLLANHRSQIQSIVSIVNTGKITVQVFEEEIKILSYETKCVQSQCRMCMLNFDDVYFLIIHFLVYHRDYHILGFVRPTNNQFQKVLLNLLRHSPSLTVKTYKLSIAHPKTAKEKNLNQLKTWFAHVFFNNQVQQNLVVTIYERAACNFDPKNYEYWLSNNPEGQSRMLDRHLNKIENLFPDREASNFFKQWNKFIFDFKQRVFLSNHFFTNFFNTNYETYFLLLIFILENQHALIDIEGIFRLHLFTCFAAQLISPEELKKAIEFLDFYLTKVKK